MLRLEVMRGPRRRKKGRAGVSMQQAADLETSTPKLP
jgi:hypothetical protein